MWIAGQAPLLALSLGAHCFSSLTNAHQLPIKPSVCDRFHHLSIGGPISPQDHFREVCRAQDQLREAFSRDICLSPLIPGNCVGIIFQNTIQMCKCERWSRRVVPGPLLSILDAGRSILITYAVNIIDIYTFFTWKLGTRMMSHENRFFAG